MNGTGSVAQLLRFAGLDESLAEKLSCFTQLVLEENRTTNLTGARDAKAFIEHIIDSLTLAQDVKGSLIDLGSGAGLPGVPLALATGRPVVLVDSMKKKAAFLRRVVRELNLACEVVDRRAESLGRDLVWRERFDCVTARAVASAPTVLEFALPLLAIGGLALLQRGSLDEREREAVSDAVPMLGGEWLEERRIGENRRVLVIRKVAPTHMRFPRREGIPEKRPLCMS